MWIQHSFGQSGGDRRVKGVATGLQDTHPGFSRKVVFGGDHPSGAHESRTIGHFSSFGGMKGEKLRVQNFSPLAFFTLHSSLRTDFSHPFLYHVRRAKGNEPTSRKEQYC